MKRGQLVAAALLGSALGGCMPWTAHREAQRQSALALAKSEDQNARLTRNGEDQANKNVDLALQNHYLKIDNADLMRQGLERDTFYDSVTRDLRRQVQEGRIKITRSRDALILDVDNDILFDSAKADLKADGRATLLDVSKAVAKSDRTVRVVGHTDNRPMAKGAAFVTNWELSTARATTVVRFLEEQGGLDPRRLLAAGRGEWQPVDTNKTSAGRQHNRRIAIMLIDKDLFE
jgi:chemotaxis protein MotB